MKRILKGMTLAALLGLALLGLNEVAQVSFPASGTVAPPWIKVFDLRGLLRAEALRLRGIVTVRHFDAVGLRQTSRIPNLIVNAGETWLRDAFNNETSARTAKDFDFHGIGTGAVAAAETDTGCGTELTTQYNPDNTRATGTSSAPSANVWRTVGTNTVDATVAITEWCLMTQAATGGGTMWSRVVFSTINLASADSLQTTYDLTIE